MAYYLYNRMIFSASGYGLAVGSAMGVSFILNKQLSRHGHKLKPNVRSTVQKIVPFTAVACASCKYQGGLHSPGCLG